MMRTLLRVIGGFLLACLAAGLVKVLFVVPPSQIAALPAVDVSTRVGDLLILTLLAATHSAIFGFLFALIAAIIGEWFSIRSALYYALAGVTIAGLGFFAQYASEVAGQPTILNTYALTAFLAAGLTAGLAYWLAAGKFAGGRRGLGLDFSRSPGGTTRGWRRPRIIVESPSPDGTTPVSAGKPEPADVKIEAKQNPKAETKTSVPTTKTPAHDSPESGQPKKT
jgi:hypothetical protein